MLYKRYNYTGSYFKLVNYLFSDYGLIILIPDNAALKREMLPVLKMIF